MTLLSSVTGRLTAAALLVTLAAPASAQETPQAGGVANVAIQPEPPGLMLPLVQLSLIHI